MSEYMAVAIGVRPQSGYSFLINTKFDISYKTEIVMSVLLWDST